MDNVVTQLLVFTGIYAVICIGTIFFMNFMTQGFFGTWFQVKASRGRKVLGICHGANRIFFRACPVSGKELRYTDEDKKHACITNIQQGMFYQGWGVMCIDIDDVNDGIWIRGKEKVAGGDVRATDSLIERAQMINGQREKIVQALIIVGIILTITVAASAFFSYHADVTCSAVTHLVNTSTVIK
jgi:hypothetical protein